MTHEKHQPSTTPAILMPRETKATVDCHSKNGRIKLLVMLAKLFFLMYRRNIAHRWQCSIYGKSLCTP